MNRATLAWTILYVAVSVPTQAGEPAFPWHSPAAVTGRVPAKILSRPAQTPLQITPPRQPYPYGWFGPNPTPQWKRSFGHSKFYTQWSRL